MAQIKVAGRRIEHRYGRLFWSLLFHTIQAGRFEKVPRGSKGFQWVPRGFKMIAKGSKGSQKIAKGSKEFQKFRKDSKRFEEIAWDRKRYAKILKSKGKKQIKRPLLNPIKGESASGPLERRYLDSGDCDLKLKPFNSLIA